jgi:hypothetical protein
VQTVAREHLRFRLLVHERIQVHVTRAGGSRLFVQDGVERDDVRADLPRVPERGGGRREGPVGLWERHDAIRGDASVDDQSEEHPHLRSVGAEGK